MLLVLMAQSHTMAATLSAGGEHTCALRSDGKVVCWSFYHAGFTPSGHFIQLSAGYAHTCGLRSDGTLSCWGDNSYGQADPPGGRFTEVSAGDSHSCGCARTAVWNAGEIIDLNKQRLRRVFSHI